MDLPTVVWAISTGRCTWEQVYRVLELAHVPIWEQLEFAAGRRDLRAYASGMVGYLIETGQMPIEVVD